MEEVRKYWNNSQTRFRQKKRKETRCWECPDRTNPETSTTGPCKASKRWLTIGFLHDCPPKNDKTVNSIESSNGGKQ